MFLDLLDRCDAQGVHVSESPHAGNYACKLFGKRPDREGFGKREFEAAMAALFAARRIRVETFSVKSRTRSRIVRDQAGAAGAP